MELSEVDQIWNRAAMDQGGLDPRPGDTALAALLGFHGPAMNGGLLHSFELHDPNARAAAIAGYRYFGLESAASVIEWLEEAAAGIDLENDHETCESLELESDSRYYAVLPHDQAIVDAFERLFSARPEVFAPIG